MIHYRAWMERTQCREIRVEPHVDVIPYTLWTFVFSNDQTMVMQVKDGLNVRGIETMFRVVESAKKYAK